MNASENEKHALEREAIEWFLGHYNEVTPKQYHLVSQQERPDALLADEQGNEFGVEIAHLYYDDQEAKMLLGRCTGCFHGEENLEHLVEKLNMLLKKKYKVGKAFDRPYPVALLIRSASPIFSGHDFELIKDKLKLPRGVYTEVWMLACDEEIPGWPHLIKLK